MLGTELSQRVPLEGFGGKESSTSSIFMRFSEWGRTQHQRSSRSERRLYHVSADSGSQRAYKLKSLEHHPDKNLGDPTAHARFARLQSAFEVSAHTVSTELN